MHAQVLKHTRPLLEFGVVMPAYRLRTSWCDQQLSLSWAAARCCSASVSPCQGHISHHCLSFFFFVHISTLGWIIVMVLSDSRAALLNSSKIVGCWESHGKLGRAGGSIPSWLNRHKVSLALQTHMISTDWGLTISLCVLLLSPPFLTLSEFYNSVLLKMEICFCLLFNRTSGLGEQMVLFHASIIAHLLASFPLVAVDTPLMSCFHISASACYTTH